MILDKVLKIYQKYTICIHCLGRMFSLLGTNKTNQQRGDALLLALTMENHKIFLSEDSEPRQQALFNLKLLAEQADYLPAQKILKKEGLSYNVREFKTECYLCHDIFDNIEKFLEDIKLKIEAIEFDSFLIGSSPNSHIINIEDKFKSEFNILEAESFKSHFNREVGKILMASLNKTPKFNNPDLLIIITFNFDKFEIDVVIRSLFVYGRYNKFIRGVPQTHWLCGKCKGKGCESCNFSGKQYNMSIEEFISPEFIEASKATDSKFHGAGREDIDVRMLGTGRPFIIELKNPKIRAIDLHKIEKRVNKISKKKVKIHDLKFSNKKEVIWLKSDAENTKKSYRALVESVSKISRQTFKEKLEELSNIFENREIFQKTPIRVSHRRANKTRHKSVYKIKGTFLKPNSFEFIIDTQGGTYIKELITGDNGRTSPSFSEIFNMPLICKELDVLEISL